LGTAQGVDKPIRRAGSRQFSTPFFTYDCIAGKITLKHFANHVFGRQVRPSSDIQLSLVDDRVGVDPLGRNDSSRTCSRYST